MANLDVWQTTESHHHTMRARKLRNNCNGSLIFIVVGCRCRAGTFKDHYVTRKGRRVTARHRQDQ